MTQSSLSLIDNTRDIWNDYRNEWLSGAALDVFHKEPLSPTSELWDLDNVRIGVA